MRVYHVFLSVLLFCSMANAATKSYICKFPVEASPKGLKKQAPPFELRFISDSESKKAYILGNNGSAEVDRIEHYAGVTFVEITATGNVMVTTISSSGESVHSRNTNLGGKLIPSQSYGACTSQ